jgi:hypothetical protein
VSWNLVTILCDDDAANDGPRAIYEITFDDGAFALSWFAVDRAAPDSCAACRQGRCVQRVMRGFDWDSDLVIHDVANELN